MAVFPGIYRAKASSRVGTNLTAFVPQVFGEQSITIKDFVGSAPSTAEMGWVAFQGGNPEFPVWFGATAVGTGTGTGGGFVSDVVWQGPSEPSDTNVELWWDTDAEVPLDPRYVATTGDDMTGHLTLPSTDPPGTYSAVHHDWMMRWINLVISAQKPKHYNAIGVAVNGTFVGETTVCTLNVPAQSVAGTVLIWSHLRLDKTVAGDGFIARQRLTNTAGSIGVEAYLQGITSGSMSWLSCSWQLAADTAGTWVTSVFRNSGTGSAQSYAAGIHNRMTALWVAN